MSKNIYVQIDWIRHGFSCANAMSAFDADTVWSVITQWEVKRNKYTSDAKLTDVGISQAQVLNKQFFKRYGKFDMICCSQLRRAMETANEVFSGIGGDIFVLPYVCEIRNIALRAIGSNGSSIPTDWKVRRAEVSDKFNWIFFETLKIDKYANASVSNFYERLLPLMIYMVLKRKRLQVGTESRPIRLAIVSHQLFMRWILNIQQKIANTGIWSEKLLYNMKKRDVVKSVGKKSLHSPEYIVFNGRKIVYNGDKIDRKYLTKESIGRCDIMEHIDINRR